MAFGGFFAQRSEHCTIRHKHKFFGLHRVCFGAMMVLNACIEALAK